MSISAIILAAGKGTRMKSDLVKVAHEVAGKPMINYVLDSVTELGVDSIYLIVGHQYEQLKTIIKHQHVEYVLQEPQLGTGHAVMQAEPFMDKAGSLNDDHTVIVLAGDCPLIKTQTLKDLIQIHNEKNAAATVLTTIMPDPASYGRILRSEDGLVYGIKEAKDCSEEELKIQEINTGVFAFKAGTLFESLKKITTENAQGEYYLTDVLHILTQSKVKVAGHCIDDSNEVIGINTIADLEHVSQLVLTA